METTYRPFAVLTAGGRDYRLKITTNSAIEAEKKLGTSLARAWLRLDEVQVQTVILHAALQGFEPGMTFEAAAAVRDSFIAEGGDMDTLADIFKEVYICSGFMKREAPKEQEAPGAPQEQS